MKPLFLYVIVPLSVVFGVVAVYLSGGRYVSTDNAYVRSGMVMVSANVSGEVHRVLVRENQPVQLGDVLFALDPMPFDLAVEGASAELDDARNRVHVLRASLDRQRTELVRAQELESYEDQELQRLRTLSQRDAVSQVKLNAQMHLLEVARNGVAAAQSDIAQARAELAGEPTQATDEFPLVRRALVVLNEAELNRTYATVRSRVSGVVARIDLHPGEYVKAGSSVFSIVESGNVWIEANLKETQLTHVVEGQKATLTLDAYPDHPMVAVVSGVSPASGSEYAVLPPQNATGNWVKVTQRVPVRLKIEQSGQMPQLRAGMTATVEIDTRQERTLLRLVSGS
jgi:membrane fusion protein (multidrug efflux system)